MTGAAVVVLLGGGAVAIAVIRGGDSEGTPAATSDSPSSSSAINPSISSSTSRQSTTTVPNSGASASSDTTILSGAPSTTGASTTDPTSASTSSVPAATAPPATTVLATVPETTLPPGPNVLGIENGKVPDPASAVPEERFVAHLGVDATAASPGTPAAIYAEWWQLFLDPAQAMASPNGFLLDDTTGQRLELSGFGRGPDSQVSDLQECVLAVDAPPLCNQLDAVISLDPTSPVVGQSPVVQFSRLAEFRLLRTRTVRFVTYRSVQPIVAATSPTGEVRLNDHLLAFEVPKDALPPDVALTVTYADGTRETLTVGL